jgi:hypothetical protein
MSDELVRFLQARFAEDAARQQDIWEQWHHRDCEALPQALYPDRETGACDCGVPTSVLAEVEAKRRILAYATRRVSCSDAHPQEDMYHPDGHADTELLRLLALPYADHPDYRAEWRAGEDAP